MGGGRGGRGVEDEEERSRIHAGNYIFKTDVTQLVISRNCKKKFCCSKFSGCGAHAPKSVAVIEKLDDEILSTFQILQTLL